MAVRPGAQTFKILLGNYVEAIMRPSLSHGCYPGEDLMHCRYVVLAWLFLAQITHAASIQPLGDFFASGVSADGGTVVGTAPPPWQPSGPLAQNGIADHPGWDGWPRTRLRAERLSRWNDSRRRGLQRHRLSLEGSRQDTFHFRRWGSCGPPQGAATSSSDRALTEHFAGPRTAVRSTSPRSPEAARLKRRGMSR